jgi:hypothetical protein
VKCPRHSTRDPGLSGWGNTRTVDSGTLKGNGFAAARFEEMKRAQHDGRTTPDEDARFREVTEMLQVLTKRLGLGDTITGWNEFLPEIRNASCRIPGLVPPGGGFSA